MPPDVCQRDAKTLMSKSVAVVLIAGVMLTGIHAIAADDAADTAPRFNAAVPVAHADIVVPGHALDMVLYRAHSHWSDAGSDCTGVDETRANAHAKSSLIRLAIKWTPDFHTRSLDFASEVPASP